MSIKNISISARLILVMSLIAILTAGLSAYLILRFIESGEQVEVLAQEGTQGIVWGEKANFHLHNLIINFYRANSGDMKWVEAMEGNIPKIHSALDEYAKTAQDPENKRLLAETREALDVYAGDISILGQSFRKGIFGPGIIQILNDLDTKTHANRLITAVANLVEYSKAMAEKNRASFFADMAANTRASIVLACVVILILIWAGYMGVVWTRDEIAAHNAKERLLQKLQADLSNSLEAAGAVSRHVSFDNGALAFVGEVDKVLGPQQQGVSNLIEYAREIHPEDRGKVLGDIPWEHIDGWDAFVRLFQDDFITVEGKGLLKRDSRLARNWIDRAGSETATNHMEFRCRAAAGDDRNWRWKRSLSKLLPDPSGLGYYGESGIVFDVTDEYEMRNELIRAKYDAEAANRAKSDFLARMSHEIRTPMNAVIGMTHLILRTEVNDAQKDYLAKILSSSQALMGIINDILDFSKIEADRMQLEELPFRLDDVFRSLADVILVKAQEKRLEVVFSVSDDTPQWLVGDSLRLGQVLINLAGNAVKFTPGGEILVNVGVVERTEHDAQLHFSVTDSGIGLTAEQIQGLFQPFSQADGTITRRFGGTGLGLAICKSLVEAMGGRIWVESQPDKGSAFHFTVRLALAPDQPTRLFLPRDLRLLKTLVIDDNGTARKSFADMLGAVFSTPPVTASSSEEALGMLSGDGEARIPFDLIFIDWQMPGRDGIETARLIKQRIRETASATSLVLMINAYELETVRPLAQLAGVDGFLAKPTCPSGIFDTVATLCGLKGEPDAGSHIVVSKERLDRVRGTRILLVDDNLFNRQVAGELLEQAGMEVEIASDGFSALEMAANNDYDLIFMDIQMPDLDGLEVTRRIRERHGAADLPIVAMTAHALSEDRRKSLDAGMNDHMTKPIDPEELLALLIKWGNPKRGGDAPAPAPQVEDRAAARQDIAFHFAEIDHRAGLARCMGSASAYLKLLRLFHQEYSGFGGQCEECATRGEYGQVRHLAHAIKGPAGSIGAARLQAAANDLEQALRDRGTGLDNRLVASFRQALEAVVADIAPVLPREESAMAEASPSVFDSDLGMGQKLLEKLRDCLDKNDPEAAALLPAFGSMRTRPELSDEWGRLHAHIGNFDFDNALEALNNIEKWLNAGGKLEDES
jgi:signal transduction histidine kinase/DNA-binding response OmpR family regulator